MPSQKLDNLRYPNVFYFLLSSAFMFGFSLWVIAFYLDVSEISYVSKINYGLRLFITFLLLYYAVCITFRDKDRVKNLVILISIPISYLFLFSISIFNFGFILEVRAIIGQFILNGLPTLIVGFLCCRYNLGVYLLLFIEKFSLIIFPAVIIYIFRVLFFSNEFSYIELYKLGKIDYLYLGYSLLILFLSSSLLLFIRGGGVFNYRWVLIIGYCAGIIISQARGAALGELTLLVSIFFTGIYNRKKVLFLLLISILAFVSYVTFLHSSPSRYKMIDESLSITTTAEYIDFSEIDKINSFLFLSKYSHIGVEIDSINRICSINNKEIAHHLSVDENFYNKLLEGDCEIKLSRKSLLVISINEIAKNPMTGMGPLGFKLKYFGYHPHNIILELLVEFGVIIGGTIISLLLYVFSNHLIRIRNLNSSSQIAFFFQFLLSIFVHSVYRFPLQPR